MMDTTLQRKAMVDSQVRPSDVTDRRVIRAMLDVPRDLFASGTQRQLAYADLDLRVGKDRAILAPRTLAKLIQLLEIEPSDVVLDVAAASGYSSALLAQLASKVVAIEADAALVAEARATLAGQNITNVTVVDGDPKSGSPSHGPYNAILINGAVDDVPEALIGQLKDGGRLVAIVAASERLARATLYRRTGTAMSQSFEFDASAPYLPGFRRARGFVF